MRDRLLAVTAMCGLFGCSATNDLPPATASAAKFHQQLNAAQFDRIYASTTPAFKSAAPATVFVGILAAVHRKLGNFRAGTVTGWKDGMTTQGHLFNLQMRSAYDKGAAVEDFTFSIDNGSAAIRGYNIDSPTLITS